MSASILIYRAAGEPPTENDGIDGPCRLCGDREYDGVSFSDWVKDTFMDHDKLKIGTIICRACLFCADDRSVLLQTKLGRGKPQRMRNYSHFVVSGQWMAYHKGQKRGIAAALQSNPEVAVIAMSGQKHLIFRARPGWWQIEEQAQQPSRAQLFWLAKAVEQLLPGFSKTEIESGHYAQYRIVKYGLAQWNERERVIAPHRGSLIFTLAVWLAQKDETDGQIRTGESDPRADMARDSERLQNEVRVEHLDAIREQRKERGAHDEPAEVRQRDLF